jgi:hypothetical protein
MLVVRYAALVALVVWMSGLTSVAFGTLLARQTVVSYTCGAVILISLFVMKFVGPPPAGFIPRAAITAGMLILAVIAATQHALAPTIVPVTMALGFVLLFWYVRE